MAKIGILRVPTYQHMVSRVCRGIWSEFGDKEGFSIGQPDRSANISLFLWRFSLWHQKGEFLFTINAIMAANSRKYEEKDRNGGCCHHVASARLKPSPTVVGIQRRLRRLAIHTFSTYLLSVAAATKESRQPSKRPFCSVANYIWILTYSMVCNEFV